MKSLIAAATTVALLTGAGVASAQMYPQAPQMPPSLPMYQPMNFVGAPSWMQDDGSSSDYPIHNPGDRSGDAMNAQYQGGIPTAPGHGFPAYPGEE